MADEKAEFVPPKCRVAYERAIAGELSPRRAIKVFCCHCVGWEGRPGRSLPDEIASCPSKGCPLHAYRPGAVPATKA